MKKLLVVLFLVLGLARLCFADVTAEIIAVDKDNNGNIQIKTQYKIDGVEVQSNYPPLNGKYYWINRYDIKSFAGMTKAQILLRIKKDIISFEKNLIQKKYMEINNDIFVTAGQNLVGATNTQTTTSVYVDTNSDGILDTEWVLKSDSTRTELPYTPTEELP